MSLFQYLEDLYFTRGYVVYSKHSSVFPASPEWWKGPLPDLIVEKGNERGAVFLESFSSLQEDRTPSRWSQVLNNDAVLKLYVRSPAELNFLKKILKREGVPADVALIERMGHSSRSAAHSRRKWIRIAMVLVLISVICLAVLWVGAYLYDYQGNYYQPRDQERETGQNEP